MTKDETAKINMLVAQMAQLTATFTERMSKLDEVSDDVKEINRTLRGHNGTPGLLTLFELFKVQINSRIDTLETRVTTLPEKEEKKDEDHVLTAKIEEQAPTYKWYREKFVIPITITVILGLFELIQKIVIPYFVK